MLSARSSVTVIAASARSASPFSRYMERESNATLITSRSTPRPSAMSCAISTSTPTTFSPSIYSNGGHAASVATISFPLSLMLSSASSAAIAVEPAIMPSTIETAIHPETSFFIIFPPHLHLLHIYATHYNAAFRKNQEVYEYSCKFFCMFSHARF